MSQSLALLAATYDACLADLGKPFPQARLERPSTWRSRLSAPLFYARPPETTALEVAHGLLRRMACQYLLLDDTRSVVRFQGLALLDRLGDFAAARGLDFWARPAKED